MSHKRLNNWRPSAAQKAKLDKAPREFLPTSGQRSLSTIGVPIIIPKFPNLKGLKP
jgi:hypothetical protein